MENCTPICRVCMQTSREYVDFDMPLQNENEEDTSITYLDFFFECTRIEVEPHEGGSQCFCLPCADELRSFYKFIKIAQMSNRVLKENMLAQLRHPRKGDSTFEKIEFEPESEDDYMLNEELFNESIDGYFVQGEKCPHKDQPLGLNEHSVNKEATVARQLLVGLRVEIYHDRNRATTVSSNSSNDLENRSSGETSTNDLPNVKAQLIKRRTNVNSSGKTYKKGPTECAFCREVLKNRKHLDKHLIDEHQRRTQPCEICGKMVIRMRDHLLIHYREKNDISRPKSECPICLRKVSKQTISRHIRYVHKREGRKQSCPECLQTFADAHKLKVHMAKGHTLDKTLKCLLCSRIFSNPISLNNHLRTHTCLESKSREKVFACDKCAMIFSKKKHLDDHRRVHTAEGFGCEICHQRFSGTEGLRRHLQLHTSGIYV